MSLRDRNHLHQVGPYRGRPVSLVTLKAKLSRTLMPKGDIHLVLFSPSPKKTFLGQRPKPAYLRIRLRERFTSLSCMLIRRHQPVPLLIGLLLDKLSELWLSTGTSNPVPSPRQQDPRIITTNSTFTTFEDRTLTFGRKCTGGYELRRSTGSTPHRSASIRAWHAPSTSSTAPNLACPKLGKRINRRKPWLAPFRSSIRLPPKRRRCSAPLNIRPIQLSSCTRSSGSF